MNHPRDGSRLAPGQQRPPDKGPKLRSSPSGASSIVIRPRLLESIQHQSHARVTSIIAGAGYGKTTLVRSWADQASHPVAWLAITPAENDPWVFTRHIVERLHLMSGDPAEDRDDGRGWRGQYHDPANLPAEIERASGPFTLVLDDCEKITNPRIHELISLIIEHLPDDGSIILIGREPMPLRLGRLRALGQVRSLGPNDLRFTIAETAALMESRTETSVPEESVWRVWHKAHGWATGIALAATAISQRSPEDPDDDVQQDRWLGFVGEYVLQEIESGLSQSVRDFVLVTADLPYLSRNLCEAALGRDIGDMELWRLTRDFVISSTGPDGEVRFRYFPVIAESLRMQAETRLPAAERRRLQERAVAYLLESGDVRSAGRLAVLSADSPWLLDLLEPICRRLADRSDFDALGDMLRQIPCEVVTSSPSLEYWSTISKLGQRQPSGISEALDDAEPRWLATGQPLDRGRLFLCRGFVAYWDDDVENAGKSLHKALEVLPQEALVERLYALTMLGQRELDAGRDNEASRYLDQALTLAARLPLDEQWSWKAIAAERANTYAFRGDIHSAITKYELMVDELPDSLPHLEGLLRCRLVSLWIERDELHRAESEVRRAERLRSEYPGTWHHELVIARARLLLAKGDREGADRLASGYLKRVRRMPEKAQLVLLLARIWLSRGEMSLVRHWLADIDKFDSPTAHFFGDINRDVLAIDAELAQGHYAEALRRSEELIRTSVATLRWSVWIEATMRKAVALHHLGDVEGSTAAATEAREKGLPGGFVRSFLVPGFDSASMFSPVWHGSREASDVKRHLQRADATEAAMDLPWLTSRELEIMVRVAKGESNRDIADALFISTNTVRNHLVKAFRRLDARSRVEAVAKARQLGLID